MTFYNEDELWNELTMFILTGQQKEKQRWYEEMWKI